MGTLQGSVDGSTYYDLSDGVWARGESRGADVITLRCRAKSRIAFRYHRVKLWAKDSYEVYVGITLYGIDA